MGEGEPNLKLRLSYSIGIKISEQQVFEISEQNWYEGVKNTEKILWTRIQNFIQYYLLFQSVSKKLSSSKSPFVRYWVIYNRTVYYLYSKVSFSDY